MSEKTLIQWCHTTVNPVMGCLGCELWPTPLSVSSTLASLVTSLPSQDQEGVKKTIKNVSTYYETSTQLWHNRAYISYLLGFITTQKIPAYVWLDKIEGCFKCYAGKQHMIRGAKPSAWSHPSTKGYAAIFDRPEIFPGRMTKTARLPDLREKKHPHSPWLNSLPRLVFVSDMGDALSKTISFDYLTTEIINTVTSANGQRHIWLWLTKRAQRMAKFGQWLKNDHHLDWPDNLVAMTTITSQSTQSEIDALRKVPAKIRGLSVVPLLEEVTLDLRGIDWVIAGGESGPQAREFDLRWARSLQDQCKLAGAAFFMKQLGANIVDGGFPLTVQDRHGGDWEEWPTDLRVREFPKAFRDASLLLPKAT